MRESGFRFIILRLDHVGSLPDLNGLTRRNCLPLLDAATGPSNLDIVSCWSGAQTEMQHERILRIITAAAHNLINHLPASYPNGDTSPNRASVRFDANQS